MSNWAVLVAAFSVLPVPDHHGQPRLPLVPVHEMEGHPRLTQAEYASKRGMSASQAEQKWAASGVLKCGHNIGSAEVVGKPDIAVTVAHMFTAQCIHLNEPVQCEFQTTINAALLKIPVTTVLSSGAGCPVQLNSKRQDWAIIRLSKPLPAFAKPYSIGDSSLLRVGTPALAVNGANRDFIEIRADGKPWYGKSFSDAVVDVYKPELQSLAVRGPAAGMNSGSALLLHDTEIVAIHTSGAAIRSEEDDLNYKAAVAEHKALVPLSCKFDIGVCVSWYIRIEDQFADALKRIISE